MDMDSSVAERGCTLFHCVVAARIIPLPRLFLDLSSRGLRNCEFFDRLSLAFSSARSEILQSSKKRMKNKRNEGLQSFLVDHRQV